MPKINVTCYGPIANSKKSKSIWEDVWISWNKPNRKGRKEKTHRGPCLCSLTDLKNEPDPESPTVEILIQQGYYIPDPNSEIPEIYTSKEYIDRQEAENMIVYLLTNYYGMKEEHVWFKWKRTDLVIYSV